MLAHAMPVAGVETAGQLDRIVAPVDLKAGVRARGRPVHQKPRNAFPAVAQGNLAVLR